jgi:hypothetical protein
MSALDDIRAQLSSALGAIDGLEAYAHVKGQVNVPAAVVAPDSVTYDVTYDGAATYRLPVQVLVSLADWESAQLAIDALVAHDGTAVEAINNATSIEARVVEMTEYGATVYADKTYLGAVLMVEVFT